MKMVLKDPIQPIFSKPYGHEMFVSSCLPLYVPHNFKTFMKLRIGKKDAHEIIKAVENNEWDRAITKIEYMMKHELDPKRLNKLSLLYEMIKLCKFLDSHEKD